MLDRLAARATPAPDRKAGEQRLQEVRHRFERSESGCRGTRVFTNLLQSRFNTCVGAGYVGILSVELHFPEAGSLKGKRKYVKSAKAQLQNRFGVSVAEVDHHDLWQRARLTMSCVAREYREAEQLLDEAERYLSGQEFELVRTERDVVSVD